MDSERAAEILKDHFGIENASHHYPDWELEQAAFHAISCLNIDKDYKSSTFQKLHSGREEFKKVKIDFKDLVKQLESLVKQSKQKDTNMKMQAYVIGVTRTTSPELKFIMVRKIRPEWQKGKLNFPGGKIEPGETPLQAIVREFEEEIGIKTDPKHWVRFGDLLEKEKFIVYMFKYNKVFSEIGFSSIESVEYVLFERLLYELKKNTAVENTGWIAMLSLDNNPRLQPVSIEYVEPTKRPEDIIYEN